MGIFVYRYGLRPVGPADVSITEKEFDLACELKRKMFVLIREEGFEFDFELRRRAEDKTEADNAAPQAFLKRVSGKACRPFRDLVDLVSFVTHKIRDWQEDAGGLLALAIASTSIKALPRQVLESFGRVPQTRALEDCLRDHFSVAFPKVACFLIHRKGGNGQEELLQRVQDELGENREAITITVDAGSTWRSKDVFARPANIGKGLGESFCFDPRIGRAIETRVGRA